MAGILRDTECYGNNELEKSENIKLIVERNNIDEAVYVGDIQGDYDSSKKAGVKFIHAAYGFGTIDDDVPAIRKFSELRGWLTEYLMKLKSTDENLV